MTHRTISTTIDEALCNGCGQCVKVCPSETLSMVDSLAKVTGDSSMNCGHCEAICPTGAVTVSATRSDFKYKTFKPYNKWLAHGQFDPTLLDRLLRSRRSCRNYTDKPVALDTLTDLVNFGISAPSGTNSQRWTFTIVPSRKHLLKLGDLVARFYANLNKKAANPALRLFSKLFYKNKLSNYYQNHYPSVQRGLDNWYFHQKDTLFHGATAAIIIGSCPGASCPSEDALMASQNILLGAHTLGLGSCMIGFVVHAANLSPNIKPELKIPDNESIHACIALGHPKESYKRLIKRKTPLMRIAS